MPLSSSTNQDITRPQAAQATYTSLFHTASPLPPVCAVCERLLLLSLCQFSTTDVLIGVAPGCWGTSGCCLVAAHTTLQRMGLFLGLLFSHLFGEDFYEWVVVLISFSVNFYLVGRKPAGFCMLALYLSTFLRAFASSKSFPVSLASDHVFQQGELHSFVSHLSPFYFFSCLITS